jgi:hypothetical protein
MEILGVHLVSRTSLVMCPPVMPTCNPLGGPGFVYGFRTFNEGLYLHVRQRVI